MGMAVKVRMLLAARGMTLKELGEIGRASCRERV